MGLIFTGRKNKMYKKILQSVTYYGALRLINNNNTVWAVNPGGELSRTFWIDIFPAKQTKKMLKLN